MTYELKHFGILGMRWGRRKGKVNSSSVKGSTLNKKEKMMLEAIKKEKIRTKEKVFEMSDKQIKELADSPAMKRKMRTYNREESRTRLAKAMAITGLALFAVSCIGPSQIRAGQMTAQYVRDKRYDYLQNKYGGFDPDKVVNATAKWVSLG